MNINLIPFPVLATNRLQLRRLVISDKYEIAQLRSNEQVNKYKLIDLFDPQIESTDRVLRILNKLEPIEAEIIQIKLGLDGKNEISFNKIDLQLKLFLGGAYYHYNKAIRKLKRMISSGEILIIDKEMSCD